VSARLKLTLLFVAFALCSFALRAHTFRSTPEAIAANLEGPDIATVLASEGYLVSGQAHSAVAWIDATKASCTVRVADISPDGWFQAIVKEQTRGEILKFAFQGAFYDDQPTVRTKIAKYKARLLKYFSLPSSPVLVRAVSISGGCPGDVFSPNLALSLSSATKQGS